MKSRMTDKEARKLADERNLNLKNNPNRKMGYHWEARYSTLTGWRCLYVKDK